MATSWKKDKNWSDKFDHIVKRILGQTFIKATSIKVDATEATDFWVYELKPIRIACRIRQYEYFKKYNGEFTIRETRPGGTQTELDKILSGWGDYIFYGFSTKHNDGSGLTSWMIGNLMILRCEYTKHLRNLPTPIKMTQLHNRDGSSSFLSFHAISFPGDFIVAQERFLNNEGKDGENTTTADNITDKAIS